MTKIETKKDLPENEALVLTDNDATRAEFPSVKVEPETEEPMENKEQNLLKNEVGSCFKTNAEKVLLEEKVGVSLKEFSSNDFADIFKCSEDGKSVELDINEAKIVKIIDKLRKSNQNIDNIIKSVYNNSSEKTAMAIINNEQIDGVNIMYKLMGKDGIKICRLCVRKTLENTFNEMKDHGYEVGDREKDFEKIFGSNTKTESLNPEVEPETEEPVKEGDETVEVKKETKPIWKESDLETMGYKGKVTKKVLKDGKWTEVTEEINSRSEYEEEKWKSNSMMYSPFSKKEVQEEVINEQSPRELYYKENPSVKEKRNNLKYKTGRYFKENISKIDGVGDTVNSFEMDDFEDCFKVSLDGKAVKLNIGKDREAAKSRLVYFLKKTTLGSMAPETIADSVVYKNPNMVLGEKTINNIRANIKYAFRTTFDKLKEDGYEVGDREKDFEKAFGSN